MKKAKQVWNELTKKTGIKLTEHDYNDWMEGGLNYDKFEDAVKSFLSKEEFNAGDTTARLPGVLEIKLGIEYTGRNKIAIQENELCKEIVCNPNKYQNGFATFE